MNEVSPTTTATRGRIAVGWLFGGSLGLLGVFLLGAVLGDAVPRVPLTFALFVAGAFGGMAVADRVPALTTRMLIVLSLVTIAAVLALTFFTVRGG